MKIYLIRHAESIYNSKKILQGRQDCELSEKGLSDTIKRASTFANNYDIVFCSPLKRTRQTAEILLPNSKIIYDERIIEKGLGDWENMPNTDEKQFLLNNKVIPPNGETFEEVEDRITQFITMLKNDYKDKKILVITHLGIIYAINRKLGKKVKPIDNLEIVEVEI